jgi:hypothetical protein
MQYLVAAVRPATAREQVGGHYQFTDRDQVADVKNYYLNHQDAIGAARRRASETPNQQFAVFGILEVFEGIPKILEKKLNDAGEIVNV